MTLEEQLQDAIGRASYSPDYVKKAVELLNKGANPNAKEGRLFQWAALLGNEELVRVFLDNGAKATPEAAERALFADRNSRHIVEILLNRGVDPNAVVSYQPRDDTGKIESPPRWYTLLMVAIEAGNIDAVKLLLERGATLNAKSPNGWTALQAAGANLEVCEFLLDLGADWHGAEEMLLGLAIEHNNPDFFDRLQQLGALPQPVHWPYSYYNLSFSMAQRMVAAGADPNGTQHSEYSTDSPLQIAVRDNNVALAEFLLDAGAKIPGEALVQSIPGYRMSDARQQQYIEQLEELERYRQNNPRTGVPRLKVPEFADVFEDEDIEEEANSQPEFDDEDIEFEDYDFEFEDEEETELQPKIDIEDLQLLKLFLEHGANPNLPENRIAKNTALHTAAQNNRVNAIALLLQAGADIEIKNADGQTPLMLAVMNMADEAIPMLLDAGADINARDKDGNTLLMLAVGADSSMTFYAPFATVVSGGAGSELIPLLIQHGADVKATNPQGGTALHYAAGTGNIESMQLLLAAGAIVDAIAQTGVTPLGSACNAGQVQAAQLLLNHGANPDLTGPGGLTARQICLEHFKMEMEVVGGGELSEYEKASNEQFMEAYAAPIRAGRQKIAEMLESIPRLPDVDE